ncbi:hypothetical protein J4E85_002491 [Alternaria conjuncta]|uniref:uncharacterized protein n=1 Tax=Alternaria conjuncta TaxID=181017 RepID=UPI00222085DA|nr:uncharacterized protein J4E85_002491 [Alternaria conjuncta]KAI4934633.1 hypothetical protein J4E85_002491 [Alternaria conjuncta]
MPMGNPCHPSEEQLGHDSKLHGTSFNNAYTQTENISPVAGAEITITACLIALASQLNGALLYVLG